MKKEETLIYRLRKRAEIRRNIPRGEPDRISDILEEAASHIADLERQVSETCEDCDHDIRGGKVCESCLGTGTVTYKELYEATAQHVKELIEEIISVQKMVQR